MTTIIGPGTQTPTANKFRSTNIYGNLFVQDNTSGTIPAFAGFQRDVVVGGNLTLGMERVDASGTIIDSSSNIFFKLSGTQHAIPLQKLSYIKNVTSDIQSQLNTLLASLSSGSSNSLLYFPNTFPQGTTDGKAGLGLFWNHSAGAGEMDLISFGQGGQGGFNLYNQCTINNSNPTLLASFLPSGATISNLSTSAITFSDNINTISKTTFAFLSNVTSDIQAQINAKASLVSPNFSSLTFSGSINSIASGTFSKISYLSDVSGNVQSQINTVANNTATIQTKISDIYWASNITTVANSLATNILSFSGTLNSISTTTFGYLSGLTSNIQQQLDNKASFPVGCVMAFAGNSYSLSGFLQCDGHAYSQTQYPALFSVLGYTYGGSVSSATFKVPNYCGLFLRGAGQQTVSLGAVAGSNTPVAKIYQSPALGYIIPDQAQEINTSDYVSSINTEIKTFVTGASPFIGAPAYSFQYANAVASMNYNTAHDSLNIGNTETHPVHTSIQYFIKY